MKINILLPCINSILLIFTIANSQAEDTITTTEFKSKIMIRETNKNYDSMLNGMIPFIQNGVDAKENEYPWMVALATKDLNNSHSLFCGGTLISDRIVLTAAHCNIHPKKTVRVLYGNTALIKLFINDYEILDFKSHRDFKEKEGSGPDLALIVLKNKIFNPKSIALKISSNPSDYNSKEMTILGWGHTHGETLISNKLQVGAVKIYTRDVCNRILNKKNLDPNILCAGGSQNTPAACNYDSGGPGVIELNDSMEQISVLSFGIPCNENTNVSAYTIISPEIKKWIDATIKEYQ